MTTPTKALTVSEYMRKPESIARFAEVLGDKNAAPYIQSVLIAVSASDKLMKCSPQSVMRAALRAASLGLSCDPALKQAWIVPYGKKTSQGWIEEAQFQPHYKGLYTLAMRTGKYWQINVSAVYEGQRVLENPLTGLHLVQESNGLVGEHPGKNPGYNDVTNRRRQNEKIIGWLGYFKTKKGFEKSVWMSSVEIDDHARKYVKDYANNPNWNDAEKRPVMEMKTVLRQLLSWADLSGNEQLVEALQSDEPIDAQAEDVTPPQNEIKVPTYEDAEKTVVNIEGKGERFLTELGISDLNAVYLSDTYSEEIKALVVIVLKQDHQAEPPEQPKRPASQNMKELGF